MTKDKLKLKDINPLTPLLDKLVKELKKHNITKIIIKPRYEDD